MTGTGTDFKVGRGAFPHENEQLKPEAQAKATPPLALKEICTEAPSRAFGLENAPTTEGTEHTEKNRAVRDGKTIDCISSFTENWLLVLFSVNSVISVAVRRCAMQVGCHSDPFQPRRSQPR
jgi:hypothetical protein